MNRISLNPWPNGQIAAVVIRDDDVSYFTPPYKIEQIYDKAWKQGFKVSLGVVPNVKAINDPLVPPKYRGKMSLHKLHKNEKLAEYLKEKLIEHKIDISQHGYTHEMLDGMPEFCINDLNEIKTRLNVGCKILEECLPTKISVFIAPWNSVSKQAWNILRKYGLALCGKEEKRYNQGSLSSLFPTIRNTTHRIFIRRFHLSNKSIVRSSGMIELHPSFDWWSNRHHAFIFDEKHVEQAKKEFEKTMIRGDMFCLLNHHWGYYRNWQDNINQEMLDSFYSVLGFLNRHNVWKTTLSDIVSWIKKLEKIEVHVSAKKVVLRTPTTMQGVTIKGEGCTLIPCSEAAVKVKTEGDNTLLIYKQLNPSESEIALIENH